MNEQEIRWRRLVTASQLLRDAEAFEFPARPDLVIWAQQEWIDAIDACSSTDGLQARLLKAKHDGIADLRFAISVTESQQGFPTAVPDKEAATA